MGVLLTLIAGLVVWVVLWAIGAKSFDAFLLKLVMLEVDGEMRLLMPYMPGNRRQTRLVLAAAGYMIAPQLPGRRRED